MIKYIKSWADDYLLNANQLVYVCGLCAFVLFLLLQSHADRTDGVEYAFGIKTGTGLFHPHHVLYTAFGFVVHRALAHFISVDPLALLNVMSCVMTALTVSLFFSIVATLTESVSLSLLSTTLYTFNYATLYMGTTSEVYPYSVLCELSALLLCLRTHRLRWPHLLLVSALCALAVLFHQSAIFFVLALVIFIAATNRQLRGAASVAIPSALMTLGVYVYAAAKNDVRDLAGFLHWIFFYVHTSQFATGDWGSGLSLSRAPELLSGILQTVVKPSWQKYLISERLIVDWTDYGFYFAVSILAIALVILLLWFLKQRKIARESTPIWRRPLQLMLMIWILAGGLFVAWWNQDNIEFWYMIVAPVLLLFVLRVYAIVQSGVRLPRSLVVIAISLLAANLFGRVCADAKTTNSQVDQIIAAIGCDRLMNGDMIVGPSWDLPPAIRYQCGKNTLTASIHLAAHDSAARAEALQQYTRQLFAERQHVYFLQTELSRKVRGAYFSSAWSEVEVEAFYRPFLSGAAPVGSFSLLGVRYQIYLLRPPGSR